MRQLFRNNLTVFQTGDFIWEYLLGRNQFRVINAYESLDVADTDTLDTKVYKDLFDFVERDDWNVIVGNIKFCSQNELINIFSFSTKPIVLAWITLVIFSK